MKPKKQSPAEKKKPVVTVFLSQADYDRLTEICKDRRQSRADFLRGAIQVHESVPRISTRKLQGACLAKHLARLERERTERRRGRKG